MNDTKLFRRGKSEFQLIGLSGNVNIAENIWKLIQANVMFKKARTVLPDRMHIIWLPIKTKGTTINFRSDGFTDHAIKNAKPLIEGGQIRRWLSISPAVFLSPAAGEISHSFNKKRNRLEQPPARPVTVNHAAWTLLTDCSVSRYHVPCVQRPRCGPQSRRPGRGGSVGTLPGPIRVVIDVAAADGNIPVVCGGLTWVVRMVGSKSWRQAEVHERTFGCRCIPLDWTRCCSGCAPVACQTPGSTAMNPTKTTTSATHDCILRPTRVRVATVISVLLRAFTRVMSTTRWSHANA